MNTWIAWKNFINNYYLRKKLFTVVLIKTLQIQTLQMLIIDMQKEYIKNLIMIM